MIFFFVFERFSGLQFPFEKWQGSVCNLPKQSCPGNFSATEKKRIKVTAQQKLTEVESDINQKVFLSH
jgi:hypothetical protein